MKQEIKILNYNILHGFHKIKSPFILEEKRLESARKIIKKENPDILVLTEACYGGENSFGVNMDYKKIFNYPFGYFGKWGEYEWGNFLLSKYPIKCQTVPFGKRTAIKSKISIDKKEIYLDIIHPDPQLTEKEKIEITSQILEKNKENYFLVGDFNSISDEDSYDRNLLIKGFSRFDKTPIFSVDRFLERKFIPYLKLHKLIDTFEKDSKIPTVPTKLYGEDNKSSAMRMDFIFSSPDVKTLETRVIKSKLAEYASDHYPIIGRYKIKWI